MWPVVWFVGSIGLLGLLLELVSAVCIVFAWICGGLLGLVSWCWFGFAARWGDAGIVLVW